MNQFTFTWPAQPPGFRPERTKVFAPDQWTDVTNSIVTVPGIRSSVTVTNQGLGNFFLRLRKD